MNRERALVFCIERGLLEPVKLLIKYSTDIEQSADVYINYDNSLLYASAGGHTEIVKLLLEAGANVHCNSDWALRWASNNGHTEIVKLLLEAGADVHALDNRALGNALSNNHTEVVKVLKEWMNK